MTALRPEPSVLDLALSSEAFAKLVEDQLLVLACSFLDDVEGNAQLYTSTVGGGPRPDGSLAREPSLDAVIARAAPSGLKLFRLGADEEGHIVVPAVQVPGFLRAALLPAAREMARLKFAGPDQEPTRRQIWARKRALRHEAGAPDEAAAFEIAETDEAVDWADDIRPSIFGDSTLPALRDADGFTADDDDERLEAKDRAERARSLLVHLLAECEVPRKEWQADVAALAARIDEMIEDGFATQRNKAGALTREIFNAVEAAFAAVGETRKLVLYRYTGKIMELARLVETAGGSREERVRKALSRNEDPVAQ